MRDSRKLMIIGSALLITATLFLLAAELALRIVRGYYSYHSKPRIELVAPPGSKQISSKCFVLAGGIIACSPTTESPACKICHCGQTSCHRECDGEMMCVLKCEGLCQKK